ncbi:MAG: M18 family aminopeptidase [Candidatus Cloacimonetes bacterium]|nr:M18 family aminopeptidase [Candidatus Cloacimonadota bacterium]
MDKHIEDLLAFLDGSPTSAQAEGQISQRLEASGFKRLNEDASWELKPGGKYYVIRYTSVIAFVAGSEPLTRAGCHIAASHTDSPGLKLKPESVKTEKGITRVAVEVYGGPILATWTDRELGIAGRAATRLGEEMADLKLVDLKRPAAIIPNAAIHLNREVNKGFEYNKQTHLQAILTSAAGGGDPLRAAVAASLERDPEDIRELDLFLYDFAKARIGGLDDSLIFSGRLDNLGMTHAILSAIRSAEAPRLTCVAAFYDHEEIGSRTLQGAESSFLASVLERVGICMGLGREDQLIALDRSFLVSGDMAHAYHPSYPEKYDSSYAPVMNGGPVIKWNAGHKYTTTLESSQTFALNCEAAGVSYQKFAMRSDLLCGSTVGPVLAAQLGLNTVDVGNPLWAMHSARETAGVNDHLDMIKVLSHYYH